MQISCHQSREAIQRISSVIQNFVPRSNPCEVCPCAHGLRGEKMGMIHVTMSRVSSFCLIHFIQYALWIPFGIQLGNGISPNILHMLPFRTQFYVFPSIWVCLRMGYPKIPWFSVTSHSQISHKVAYTCLYISHYIPE
jgi:hypothetical protein